MNSMMIDKEVHKKAFWALPIAAAYEELQSSERGLTDAQAEQRIKIFGRNVIEGGEHASRLKIFGRQFKSPMIFILLIAGAITLTLKDVHSALFIFLAAFANAGLGYYQEQKAEGALEHLKSYITKRIRVIRDGAARELDTAELVPGDIIHVTQGDRVPADARLIHISDLDIDQSILTGESLPVHKTNRELPERSPIADQHCMIFGGTSVIQGFGTAIVTATDQDTQLGKIAKLVNSGNEQKTPIQRALASFSVKATGMVIGLTALLFTFAKLEGIPTFEAFLISVAILVAAVPEGLPIVITVILSIGVQRLAKRKGVIRRLSAAETLGSTSVILTDKTGTLTQAKMSLSSLRIFENEPIIKETVNQEEFLLHTALLNVDVVVENPMDHHNDWRLLGKPLEVALVKAAAQRNIHFPTVKEDKEALHILPFNSLNKFSASVYKMPSTWFNARFKEKEPYVLSLFGAPEMLLKLSDGSPEEHERISTAIRAMATDGDRVVGVAVKEVSNIEGFQFKDNGHLQGIRFLGTLSFRDPLRPSAKDAVHKVQKLGIKVVIVTGDHEGTATAIAREIGMTIDSGNIIDGMALDEMSEDEVIARLNDLKIVSRVSPEGKMKIVRAFQSQGETVAMNGDGVNDAPALKQADIGIAMGTGSDVSQDVSDLVLLDNNFETIVEAVIEGRRILGNIRKAIIYMTSTILDSVLLIGGAIVMSLPLPVNALQLLWVNFFTGSFPGIAMAFERGDEDGKRPSRVSRRLLTPEMRFLILINGTMSSVLLFASYFILLRAGFDEALVRTFVFATLGTYSMFVVLAIRNLKKSIFSYNPFSNGYLTLSIALGLLCTFAAIYVPFLQRYFDTVALPAGWLLGVLGFGILNILLIELTKVAFRKTRD